MTDTAARPDFPDRLSVDPRSPHHVAAIVEQDIGIRFNGLERSDVEEYCISAGWVKVPAGKKITFRYAALVHESDAATKPDLERVYQHYVGSVATDAGKPRGADVK